MKRYLCYFATMLLVLAITNLFLGGELLGHGPHDPNGISAGLSGVNNAGTQLKVKEVTDEENIEELGKLIASKSCEFVQAAFGRDKAKVVAMLSKDTVYMISGDNSSYIRYATPDLHVEGYMATDRRLVQVRQSWYIIEDDGTVTSAVEVVIEREAAPQIWYIHYNKSPEEWKIFMLENGI